MFFCTTWKKDKRGESGHRGREVSIDDSGFKPSAQYDVQTFLSRFRNAPKNFKVFIKALIAFFKILQKYLEFRPDFFLLYLD